ncbi:MAG: hypothetical protein IJT24_05325 [Lachnospiraceae bacterium]|nr:hypothetical protein [Lachnospiraceae bacterium]
MNKYHKQCICMILISAVLAGGAGMTGLINRPVTAHAEEYKNTEKEDAIENIVETVAGVKDVDDDYSDKEETVYIISDATGAPTEVIVSEWLKNFDGSGTIEDRSRLKDIKNVKGYEEYRQEKDGSLTWEAEGNDIYYQGTPDGEPPVSVHVTYKLDGKEISPEDIKGKSGKVEIRFDYGNDTDETINVGGETEHVSIPFTMLTGVILPNDIFSNVQVKNARLVSEGNNAIVIGYAFPGLYESLKYDEFKEKLDEEQREKAEDLDISDHVVIKADAKDFELNSTLTVALPDVLQEISLTDNIDTDKVKDDMDELADASQELIDGTSDLLDGVNDLKDGTSELKDGTSELKDGTRDIKDGTEDILSGTEDLKDGASDLRDGICEAYGGSKKLYSGGKKLDDGAGDAYSGSKQLNSGIKKVASLLSSKSGDVQTLNKLVEYLNGQVSPALTASSNKTAAALAEELVSMNSAGALAAESVESLSLAGTVSDDTAEDTREYLEQSVKAASDTAEALSGSVSSLSLIISEKNEELEEEKKELEERLEELGEPEPSLPEPETASVSEDGEAYDHESYCREYYKEYYRDYYSSYYELKGRMDTVDELMEILEVTAEQLEPVTVSVNEMADGLSGVLEHISEDSSEDEDKPDDGNDIKELVISANRANSEAVTAVWRVVEELQEMNMLDDSFTDIRYMASGSGSSMTPEELVQQLLSIPDAAMRNQVMRQLLSDPSTQVQAAAVIASLDPPVRSALQMDTATTTLLNTIVKNVVSSGMNSITETLSSPETKKSLAKLTAGAGSLMNGLGTLSDGTSELKDKLYDLRDGMRELSDGGVKLYDGTVDLNDGMKDLDEGAGDLNDGMSDLDDGAQELDDGAGELFDGAEELHDGMVEFNDEGIQKLIDLFGDNVTDMLDRLDAIQKTGSSYQSFSGKSDDMKGSVKFILKTGEIKEDD